MWRVLNERGNREFVAMAKEYKIARKLYFADKGKNESLTTNDILESWDTICKGACGYTDSTMVIICVRKKKHFLKNKNNSNVTCRWSNSLMIGRECCLPTRHCAS